MNYSLHFDPTTDNYTKVAAALAAIFGVVAGTPSISPNDAPDVGEEAGATGVNPATLDKSGIPWDGRIHSETPVMTTAGVWRKKRGVAATTTAEVTAALLAKAATGQMPPPALAVPPATPAGTAPALSLPAMGTLAPPPPLAPSAYDTLVKFLVDHTAGPANVGNPKALLDPAYINNALTQLGVEGGQLQSVASFDPTRINSILDAFKSVLGIV